MIQIYYIIYYIWLLFKIFRNTQIIFILNKKKYGIHNFTFLENFIRNIIFQDLSIYNKKKN